MVVTSLKSCSAWRQSITISRFLKDGIRTIRRVLPFLQDLFNPIRLEKLSYRYDSFECRIDWIVINFYGDNLFAPSISSPISVIFFSLFHTTLFRFPRFCFLFSSTNLFIFAISFFSSKFNMEFDIFMPWMIVFCVVDSKIIGFCLMYNARQWFKQNKKHQSLVFVSFFKNVRLRMQKRFVANFFRIQIKMKKTEWKMLIEQEKTKDISLLFSFLHNEFFFHWMDVYSMSFHWMDIGWAK